MSLGKTLYENEQEGFIKRPKEIKKTKRPTNKIIQVASQKDTNSTEYLLSQLWYRIRPSWTSLKYFCCTVFTKDNILRLTILTSLAYFVLFYNQKEDTPIFVERNETASIIELEKPSLKKEKKVIKKAKNENAPIDGKELVAYDAEKYIKRFSTIAKTEQKKHGIPASISLAQGLIESRAGTSKLATKNNNHFGMKCFSKNCSKGHCTNHTDDTHKDFFRKYQDPLDSWKDHSRMLSQGRYSKLKKYGNDYKKWAYGLKSIGYATDKQYAEKLIGVIEKYQLNRFDQ
ncbi:MAG: glycoside hydrolase family 73 protein [Chitinophagales bacterium]|jgi:flagellum-specific peptidoglycan hydrolase FlgJ